MQHFMLKSMVGLIKDFKNKYGKLSSDAYTKYVAQIRDRIKGLLLIDVNNIFKNQYNTISQLGGNLFNSKYHHKYLKYKTKYLQLKNS